MSDQSPQQRHIAFLGGGNMAEALIGGLINRGGGASTPGPAISVADPEAARRELLSTRFAVRTYASGAEMLDSNQDIDALVLAVKPQLLSGVLTEALQQSSVRPPLLLSIAAGVTIAAIRAAVDDQDIAVVRAMPNTPALIGEGISGFYAAPGVTETQMALAEQILGASGPVCRVECEAALDLVTAISGSGPAYYFFFTQALIEAGIELGLAPEQAELLAKQTALGAACLMQSSDEDPAELRRRVTSPGGTTERAIAEFESGKLRELVSRAARAAAQRASELAADTNPD